MFLREDKNNNVWFFYVELVDWWFVDKGLLLMVLFSEMVIGEVMLNELMLIVEEKFGEINIVLFGGWGV